jgi:cytidyltransferase-like protein
MKKELLQEGAVAGHMNHIYDNGEMTFGELKQLLQAAVDGKLRGTEKTDGQNVYLSFDVATQKARAIRNKTHILAGGLDVEQFDEFFSAHPNQALRYSFVEALQAFEDVVREFDKDTQLKIFGTKEDNIYFNTEVMNPGAPGLEEDDPRGKGTTNVIPYDKKTLLIHAVGHDKFHPKTALSLTAKHLGAESVDISSNYETLERALMGKGTEEPGDFSVETHPQRKLEPAGQKKAAAVLESSIDAINNLVRDFGLDDSSTIQDLVMVQITPVIDNFGLTEDRNKLLIQRLMGLCRSLKDRTQLVPCGLKDPVTKKPLHEPRPTMKDITAGIPQELKDEIKQFDSGFKYQNYTAALSNSLYDFTNAILQDFHSAFISDNEATIKKLQDEISNSVKKIQSSSNEAAKEDLKKQFAKLKDVQNINTPSEGFVFDFNGTTYKFTGWFAPSNQILGTERYGRFGPIEPAEEEKEATQGESEPLTIAVVPGAFKPPHKGHLSMVESLAENVDKVIIIISTPTKGGRALPSGKIINSDHAVQIWNAFLDSSPAGTKTTVIKSPAASPVGVTYDFVMKQPDPTDQLVAPPNSTVVLGCGDKEDDKTRFQSIISKARKDLEIKVQVCELSAKHSPEYMNLLKSYSPILDQMPSNKKSTVESEDLHASDMRFIIDVASKEPIGLSMLQDFVPTAEDALAVMGILGLNPADQRDDESDQVKEPEIDELAEIIAQSAHEVFETFKRQKAPKGKKASGKFQKSMKAKLAKAHSTYLDMGRKDLTKHGGGFHLDRPKGNSNAFLAEDEVDEASTNAGGALQGGLVASQKTSNTHKRKDKKMTKQETKLRMKIRKGLREFFQKKSEDNAGIIKSILDEHALRMRLREVILEQSLAINEVEDPTIDVHDNTGINTLKDLLKNTNVLSTLREIYKTLTTNEDQKNSFRAHVIQWVQDTLAPVKLNDTGRSTELSEEVGIDVKGVEAAKFIDAQDGSEKENPEQDLEDDESLTTISGEDTTGRNKAERIYPNIEKSIVNYYAELDNPEDQEMFYDYLIANLKLYFDKWDGEMSTTAPEEPTNDQYDQAKNPEETPGLSAP